MRERLAGRREALALERKGLPASIGALAADGKKLVDTLVDVEPASRRLVDARLADISRQIAAHETRLAEVERQVAALDDIQAEAEMVARLLADFDAVWSALTVENRGRLVRALVREVGVDEPGGQVTLAFVDLQGDPAARDGEGAGAGGTFSTSFHRRRRGGRIVFGDEPPPPARPKREPERRPTRAAITLAFAHKLRQALDDGRIKSATDAAKRLGVTRSRVTQVLNLTLLPVAEQERILFQEAVGGKEPGSERSLRVARAIEVPAV